MMIILKMKMMMVQVDLLATHYYSHKFVCVAPYSTDTLLLINIPKTMLEKVIKVIRRRCGWLLDRRWVGGIHCEVTGGVAGGSEAKC